MDQLPAEVRSILAWWRPRIEGALGDRIAGVALCGGLAMGEFAPRWSDVDVCVWVREPLTASEGARVEDVRGEMHDVFLLNRHPAGGWVSGQAVEPTFLPTEGAALPRQPGQPAFDRLVLSRHGRALWGETVVVAPPTREHLEAQLHEELARLDDPPLDRPIWLTDMILWIGRSLVFWRDGELMGKSAALEREVAAGSPFSEAFRFALRLRDEGSAACARHLAEARDYFLSVSPPAADTLSRALR